MNEIEYIDRSSGQKQIEAVPGGSFLKFLYGGNVLGKLSLWVLIKRKLFSTLGGWYMNSKSSEKRIIPFVEQYEIDLNDYHIPQDGFKHFNDFFYRKIKGHCRPVEEGIVSPADGKLLVFPTIQDSHLFFVKGQQFSLSSFLNSDSLADKYANGSMAIIRLAPVDYHRYHFPVSGMAGENKKIKGAYYSVSPLALRKRMRIFCENKREFMEVQSEEYGDVLICDVGATLTGGIIQTYQSGKLVEKGDEKGYFAFGGSTLILLFEKMIQFSEDLVVNTKNGFETTIKMGEQIGE